MYEGKKNYYCSNKDCAFAMWKNDRFFEERKTGKTYDGIIVLADTDRKYVNYRVELPKKE